MREERGNIVICGSNRKIKVRYDSKGDAYFNFNGSRYKLSNFMRIPMNQPVLGDFSGYMNTTAWSGVLVKVIDDETVMVYTYHTS